MRRLIGFVVLGMTLTLAAPGRADAAWGGFFDWLQELSGPGNFNGAGFELGVGCLATPLIRSSAAPAATAVQNAAGRGGEQNQREWRWLCTGPLDKRQPIHQFSFAYSDMQTDNNPYPYDPALAQRSADVRAQRFGGAADFSPFTGNRPAGVRSLTFGTGFGFLRFSGDRFDSFWKPYIEPRVIFKPLAAFACKTDSGCAERWTAWDIIDVRFRLTVFGGVDPVHDFGALSGGRTGSHVQPTVTIGATYGW